jgi:hypothetical protein
VIEVATELHLLGATLLELSRIEAVKVALNAVPTDQLLAMHTAMCTSGDLDEVVSFEHAASVVATTRSQNVYGKGNVDRGRGWESYQPGGKTAGADAENRLLLKLLAQIADARAGRAQSWVLTATEIQDSFQSCAEKLSSSYVQFRREGTSAYPSFWASETHYSPFAKLSTMRTPQASDPPAPVPVKRTPVDFFNLPGNPR